jgi:hypothetical protein
MGVGLDALAWEDYFLTQRVAEGRAEERRAFGAGCELISDVSGRKEQ